MSGKLLNDPCIYIFFSSVQVEGDTRSNKRSFTGLNSEVSFLRTCCHTNVKELSALQFTDRWMRINSMYPFSNSIGRI